MMYYEFIGKLEHLRDYALPMHPFPGVDDYHKIIEPVYLDHPMLDDRNPKMQLAMMYAAGGMSLMKKMLDEVHEIQIQKKLGDKIQIEVTIHKHDGKEDHDGK